jgi:putative phage-type endonuclease
MKQQSNEWLEWRKKGIGSSDAPVIMGVSPWKTPYQLWEEKTGRVEEKSIPNFAMQRGIDLEPKARAYYELLMGEGVLDEMPPSLMEHPEYPYLRASLDGYNPRTKVVLEIKCPGEEDHEKAKQGQIPEKYIPQITHQVLVTGAKRVDYLSFDGNQGVVVPFIPDDDYIRTLLDSEQTFWDSVRDGNPPSLSPRDYRKITDSEITKAFHQYQEAKINEKKWKETADAFKELITKQVTDTRAVCDGITLTRSMRSGSIDYGKIPEIKKLDPNYLEQFRKKGSSIVTIRLPGEKE